MWSKQDDRKCPTRFEQSIPDLVLKCGGLLAAAEVLGRWAIATRFSPGKWAFRRSLPCGVVTSSVSEPRSKKQRRSIVSCIGAAGCGRTLLASLDREAATLAVRPSFAEHVPALSPPLRVCSQLHYSTSPTPRKPSDLQASG